MEFVFVAVVNPDGLIVESILFTGERNVISKKAEERFQKLIETENLGLVDFDDFLDAGYFERADGSSVQLYWPSDGDANDSPIEDQTGECCYT